MARNRKTPSTRFPHAVVADYYVGIRKLLDKIHSNVWKVYKEEIKPRIYDYRSLYQDDEESESSGSDPLEIIQEVLDQLRESNTRITFSKKRIQSLASNFVQGVNRFNIKDVEKQAEVVKAIDPTVDEPWLNSFMKSSIKENVNYITSIAEEYHNKIETVIMQGVKGGESLNDMASEIKNAYKVSDNRAKFIARDQTGSILGQMTANRHKNMGANKFKWKTSKDERVRGNPTGRYPKATPSHYDLDGKVYNYEDPPHGLIPGRDYNCRCVAIPVFEE